MKGMYLVPVCAAAALGAALAPSLGCGSAQPTEVGCNVEGVPELPDEALACATRGVDGGGGVTYWLLPLTPVVVSETGVIPYVLVAANTSQAPSSSLLARAAGEWFFEPEDGEPISIKAIAPDAGPAVEAGPGEIRYWPGSVGVWGAGVPDLGGVSWVNLRLELRDADRTVSMRLRLPVRAERDRALVGECWRAITVHRDRLVRDWALRLPAELLGSEADD